MPNNPALRTASIVLFTVLLHICFSVSSATAKDSRWRTHFERSNYLETSRYNETLEYFTRLASSSPYARLLNIGRSPQGRDIVCLVVSKDKAFTPGKARQTGKPVILVQNGIHAGEIEGKDACMLLLRDMLVYKKDMQLLDSLIIVVIPVINADGHERMSRYNRINQNGPLEMGWRTTAQNHNLNRDLMKSDAPETRTFLKLYNSWLPDFFIDSHTTDGADFQYTLSYSVEMHGNTYQPTSNWLRSNYIPRLEDDLLNAGYLSFPYIGFRSGDFAQGMIDWAAIPRLTTGYCAIQNRPSALFETHMLKPYKDRVFSTLEALKSTFSFLFANKSKLMQLNAEADRNSVEVLARGKAYLPVAFSVSLKDSVEFLFKGYKYSDDSSAIAGARIRRYSADKTEMKIPYFNKVDNTDSVLSPAAYLIPSEWTDVIDRLELHGIEMERLKKDTMLVVERYRFHDVSFANWPNEGRMQPKSFQYSSYTDTVTVGAGTYMVRTAQRRLRVILNLLEPKAPDSFVSWGFFNPIFERKEYFEDYSMEPIARKMAEEDPKLKAEFEKRLAEDEAFRNSPYQRLNFFYERSRYYDSHLNVYPVMRIVNK